MKTGCLFAFVVMSTGLLTAQMPVSANRPASIPSDYVITPFGYFHSSCVQSIKENETLLEDGSIQHVDGSRHGGIPCAQPSFEPDGSPRDTTPKATVPQDNGYMADATAVAPANHSYSGIYNTNKVPPSPANDELQTLYFFPGLEDVNDQNTSILQPVLAYYDYTWTVANWNCCINGVTTHSNPIITQPGNEIVSVTAQNCPKNTLSCKTWNISSVDTKTKLSTTLSHTPSEGQIFNWAFAAVTEIYNVNTCDDLPPEPETYHTIFFDEKFKPVSPKWTVSTNTDQNPQCGWKIKIKCDDFTLEY